MSGWIVIPNWDKFQHYSDREPIWLRHYVDQLDRDEYVELSACARALLHDVRLLYARRRFQVPASPSWLRGMTGLRVKPSHIEELNHAGFIAVVDSKPSRRPASPRALARREVEEKRNPPTPLTGESPNGKVFSCDHCPGGLEFKSNQRLAEHLRVVHEIEASA